jgi:hypothetical protein
MIPYMLDAKLASNPGEISPSPGPSYASLSGSASKTFHDGRCSSVPGRGGDEESRATEAMEITGSYLVGVEGIKCK